VVEIHGDAWIQPENIEVNGPYKLQEWRQNNYVLLSRNEGFFENGQVCIDEIFYYPTRDPSAGARRVRNGELHINNEFPGQDLEFLMRDIPDYVRITPFMGTVYFSIDTENEKFEDPRVRNALGMVINRQFIAEEIQIGGWEPAYSLVPPQVANYPGGVEASWADMPREERLVEARRLLEEAGYGPDNPLDFLYTYRATGDNPRIAPVVQANWSEIADWVNPEIQVRDTQLHYAAMRAQDFEVGDGGWIADYNDPYNFIFLGETRSQPMNYARYSNPEFDTLVVEANQQLDVETRGAMLAEAEQMWIDDMPIIPILFYIKRNLVNPEVTGWVDNAVDIHRTRYLCLAEDGEEG
jgi:oligopeptide transport system substrate-binding protein